jgi:hypothetical protein|tara:strand:- start:437 stop:742 length:306 start_codon:yes stop_codon:yes gene_type:complete
MKLDHRAIRKAYPNAVVIDDGAGVFDADNKSITIDQSLVDAARTELDKLNYQGDRKYGTTSYASFGDQLDMLYADIVAGKLDTTGTWATHIKAVKDANPKP